MIGVEPPVTVTRFAQIEPGDLFIGHIRDRAFVGIKVLDPENGPLVLPLNLRVDGDEAGMARFMAPWGFTVVSFGKQFTLRLPIDADSWLAQEPGPEVVAVMIEDGIAYFRANFSPRAHDFRGCFVRISDGQVTYDQPTPTSVWTHRWELVIPDGSPAGRSVPKLGLGVTAP